MKYVYCEKWNYSDASPGGSLTEPECRDRFEGRVPEPQNWFTVAGVNESSTGGDAPEFVLEVTDGARFVYVHLVDEWQRICIIYFFEKHGEKMFLFSRMEYTYSKENEYVPRARAQVVESILFRPDGHMRRERDDDATSDVEVWEYRDVDMKDNWEPVPDFGGWEQIGRYRG